MGEIVTASVSSQEDHGYIMDIWSNTIRGFVPAKTMSKVRLMITLTIANTSLIQFSCGVLLITRTEAGVRKLSPVASKVWTTTPLTPTP